MPKRPNFSRPFLTYLKNKLPITRNTKSGISYTIFVNDEKMLCISSQHPLAEITNVDENIASSVTLGVITTTFNEETHEYVYTSKVKLE